MFKFHSMVVVIALLLFSNVTASRVAAQSVIQDYLPLSMTELGRAFPVRRVGTIAPGENVAARQLDIGVSAATLQGNEEGEFMLTGKDRAGNAWSVALGGMCGASEGYTADLDGSGTRDFVLVAPTCGNGLAPSSHFTAVTFEPDGRPVRFEAEGYFTASARGIFDLRDLNGDGHAELIYMNFDDGYWITNLYTATGARWQRVKGRFGARTYPLYTRFTNRPNRRAVTPQVGRHPFAPDLSNDAPHTRARLLSYRWADVSQSEDVELNSETLEGGQLKCQPVSWYASFTILLDRPGGRKIFSLAGEGEEFKLALDEIIASRAEVALYGERDREGCHPELLWVTMK